MKKYFIIFIFIVSTILLNAGDNNIKNFTAKSNGTNIYIQWESSDEINISDYRIERSLNGIEFSEIKLIKANGYASKYDATDNEAYLKGNGEKNTILSKKYFYRIKIIRNNSFTYSDPVEVAHSTNVAKRTWGMIKEMFR